MPAQQEEQPKPRLGMHKRGSHAVPIVAPPKEEKPAAKAPAKKNENSEAAALPKQEDKVEKTETVELVGDASKKTEETKEEKAEPKPDVNAVVAEPSVEVLEPSAPPAEDDDLPAPAPAVQAGDADSCSDSGNDSDIEQEAALENRVEARGGPPSFAANLSMDNESERSR